MSAARSLFEQIADGGEAEINRMIDEGRQEGPFLDFKAARDDSAPMREDDRKTLSEAISGFANSEGGVIVWGVDCRGGTGPDDPDVARAVKPIAALPRWVSDLNSYTPQVVVPEVVGVEHRAIPMQGKPDSGFAVTYVPRTEGLPHMAIGKKKEQYCYFVRSGSSFVKMEHFMLADRFGRRPLPKLELFYNLSKSVTQDRNGIPHHLVHINIGLRNTGRGIALYPAMDLSVSGGFEPDVYGVEGTGRPVLPERPRSSWRKGWHMFAAGADVAIYPNTELDVTRLNKWVYPIAGERSPMITYKIYCDGFSDSGTMEVPWEEIRDVARP